MLVVACATRVRFPLPHSTGKERDAESGNDYFGKRYYASSMGRFLSPDPVGDWAASPGDPQSWNQYAYVDNNPLTMVDPAAVLQGSAAAVEGSTHLAKGLGSYTNTHASGRTYTVRVTKRGLRRLESGSEGDG
jgi:RHS repeat-associated protein